MIKKGQSELLTVIAFIGLSLVIGVAAISYFSSVISNYRTQLDLSNYLKNEASNLFLNVISYDIANSTLWILLKRFDGSSNNFFIAVDTGSRYINCSNIFSYNPYRDNDAILCNSATDCITSTTTYSGSTDRVYIPWEGSLSDLSSFSRAMGYTVGNINICRVENVCRYASRPGLCDESTIVRITIPRDANIVRILIATLYSNMPYVVGIHEVAIR